MLSTRQNLPHDRSQVVFVDGLRTPFVPAHTEYRSTEALELVARAIGELLHRLQIRDEQLDAVICGTEQPQLLEPNLARKASYSLDIAERVPCHTVHSGWASGLASIAQAFYRIRSGEPAIMVAAGVESASNAPLAFSNSAARFLTRLGHVNSTTKRLAILRDFPTADWMPKQTDKHTSTAKLSNTQLAQQAASNFDLPHAEQDEYAMRSHQLGKTALEKGYLKEETFPFWTPPDYQYFTPQDKISTDFMRTEARGKASPMGALEGDDIEKHLAHAADGAGAALIVDQQQASDLQLTPKSQIVDIVTVREPLHDAVVAPVRAILELLFRNQMHMHDVDLFEIHEASAAQILACLQSFAHSERATSQPHLHERSAAIPLEKLNVNGGAIALGHPAGATGIRLVSTLTNELIRQNKSIGIVCIGDTDGTATAVLLRNLRRSS